MCGHSIRNWLTADARDLYGYAIAETYESIECFVRVRGGRLPAGGLFAQGTTKTVGLVKLECSVFVGAILCVVVIRA